jgi:eukaryotic-like serine/threonine-protein kinase
VSLPDPFAGRFSKPRLIGTGGFGTVYRAFDTELERDVALKFLKRDLASDPDLRKRFRQEATAVSRLSHPNITIVFDRGEFDGEPYIVMEFVEGETLARIIERRQPLGIAERLFLLEQLCDGLHFAHQRNVVHRDVKPVNLIVREEHSDEQLDPSVVRTLKILDFGIARVASAAPTVTGRFMFSPSYVSPEQVRGRETDRRSDLFAVGAVAYELLSHRKAFPIVSTNAFHLLEEVKRKIVDEPHLPLSSVEPDIDPELAATVDRALAKEPEDRYRDLAEMRRDLRRIRERLEETGDTALGLTREQREAVRDARAALERNDPTAAVRRIEGVLADAKGWMVRRSLEQLLEEMRERQTAKRGEAQRRLEQAAREASARARAGFARGNRAGAISTLQAFEPQELIADALRQLHAADDAIVGAERDFVDGTSADRDAALQLLEAFEPLDLVSQELERLREVARERAESEALEAEARADEAAGLTIERARQAFAAGDRGLAMALLRRHDDPQRVAPELARLAAIEDRLRRAEVAVRRVGPGRRRHVIDDVEHEIGPLAGAAIQELRSLDAELTAAEARESQQQADLAAARRLVAEVDAQFAAGACHEALKRLEAYQPRVAVIEESILRLATRLGELEAMATEAVRVARERFAGGSIDGALAQLEAFEPRELVETAWRELRNAKALLRSIGERVEAGGPSERAAALRELDAMGPPALFERARREIGEIDSRRCEQEASERAAAEARRAAEHVANARAHFIRGDRDRAIRHLAAFAPQALVADAAAELSRAALAIAQAREAVAKGSTATRSEALTRLAAFTPADLVANALIDLQRSAATRAARDGAATAASSPPWPAAGALTTVSIPEPKAVPATASEADQRPRSSQTTPAGDTRESTETTPRPSRSLGAQSNNRRYTRLIAAAAVSLIAVAMVAVSWRWFRDTSGSATPAASPPAVAASPQTGTTGTEQVRTPEPPAAVDAPVMVVIAVRPWARVTITPAGPGPQGSPVTADTPARFALHPGEYEVRLENTTITRRALTDKLVVGRTPIHRSYDIPGFNPEATVNQLLNGSSQGAGVR